MSYDPSITFFASFIPMFFSFASLIELAFYIIGSIGLYSMANNTGMKNPWLAWIPVAREYLLGSLADRYNCTSRQKKTSFAIWLTVASVIQLPVIGFILLSIPLISSMMYFSLSLLLVLLFLVLIVARFCIWSAFTTPLWTMNHPAVFCTPFLPSSIWKQLYGS